MSPDPHTSLSVKTFLYWNQIDYTVFQKKRISIIYNDVIKNMCDNNLLVLATMCVT